MPRLRLLLTTDAVGGVWRYSIDLARGLAERGLEPVLAVLGPGASPEQRREAEEIPGLRLVATGLPLDWTAPDQAALDGASQRLATLAGLLGVGAVHLHAPALLGDADWPVPVAVVAHSCLGTWWRAMRGDAPVPPDFAWRIAGTEAGLRRAATVIAPSRAHAEALRAVYGVREVTVVHNGAAAPAPVSNERERAVLTAGRLWDEAKGAALLDRMAPRLSCPLRAAGPTQGPNGEAIVLHHVEQLGRLDAEAMRDAYARHSVFVSAAQYEPFGLSVLEAAQAGMRLVLLDRPGFRELWDGAALFASADDLLPALEAALAQPGDGGAAQHAARYSVDAMVDGTLAAHRLLRRAA